MTSKEAVNLFKQYYWKVEDKEKALEILEELAERDTPKKVIYEEPDIPKCPNCNSPNCTIYNGHSDDIELNFCDDCGQRLDWSD